MYGLGEDEFAINLKLLEKCRFIPVIFDTTHCKTVFGWNAYRTTYVAVVVAVQLMVGYGIVGLFYQQDDPLSFIDTVLLLHAVSHNYHLVFKLAVFWHNLANIRGLFDVARLDFLKSDRCAANVAMLYERRRVSVKLTNLYCSFCALVIVQWILFPIAVNAFRRYDADNERFENIINMPYPVTVQTFNRYYPVFYAFETCMSVHLMYGILLIDSIVLSFGWAIVTQYRVLAKATEDLGHRIDRRHTAADCYNDLKSILNDHIHLEQKIDLYYSIVKPIILMYVAATSFLFVLLTFSFISICMSKESIEVLQVFKIGTGVLYLCCQLFIYCYLCANLHDERQSVSFGLYSSNWTMMDVKFKKLILMAMRIIDVNTSKMKFSPNLIIDMELFSDVLVRCFNIISLLIETLSSRR